MSIDTQSPETTAPTPEAPWGFKPDGTPYKRDPSAFAHLRGQPFGSLNGNAPSKRGAAKSTKPRATLTSPPQSDAAGYAKKFSKLIRAGAKAMSRRAPAPAAIVAVRSADMAEAWGRVAVSYPKFGRLVDRFGKTGDLGDAIGGTVMTLALIAHAQGLTQGTPMADVLDGYLAEVLHTFGTSVEFAGMRDKMAERAGVPTNDHEDQGDDADH